MFNEGQQKLLIEALNNAKQPKIKANLMLTLAVQGNAAAIRPMIEACSVVPAAIFGIENDGIPMQSAVEAICRRYPDDALPVLLEIVQAEVSTKMSVEQMQIQAKVQIASHCLASVYGMGQKSSLADALFRQAMANSEEKDS